jgi:hypothetical protein
MYMTLRPRGGSNVQYPILAGVVLAATGVGVAIGPLSTVVVAGSAIVAYSACNYFRRNWEWGSHETNRDSRQKGGLEKVD